MVDFFHPSAGPSSDNQNYDEIAHQDNLDFSASDFKHLLTKKHLPILDFFKKVKTCFKPIKSQQSPQKKITYQSDDSDEALFRYTDTNEY